MLKMGALPKKNHKILGLTPDCRNSRQTNCRHFPRPSNIVGGGGGATPPEKISIALPQGVSSRRNARSLIITGLPSDGPWESRVPPDLVRFVTPLRLFRRSASAVLSPILFSFVIPKRPPKMHKTWMEPCVSPDGATPYRTPSFIFGIRSTEAARVPGVAWNNYQRYTAFFDEAAYEPGT